MFQSRRSIESRFTQIDGGLAFRPIPVPKLYRVSEDERNSVIEKWMSVASWRGSLRMIGVVLVGAALLVAYETIYGAPAQSIHDLAIYGIVAIVLATYLWPLSAGLRLVTGRKAIGGKLEKLGWQSAQAEQTSWIVVGWTLWFLSILATALIYALVLGSWISGILLVFVLAWGWRFLQLARTKCRQRDTS